MCFDCKNFRAGGLSSILRDVGPVIGLAAAVYLLAPAKDEDEPQRTSAG
jgi:hypothetical protein